MKCSLKHTNLVVLLLITLFQCRNAKTTQTEDIKQLVVQLKTSSCMGACPVYEISVFDDLSITYVGIENTERLGSFSGKISKSKLEIILSEFEEAGFPEIEVNNSNLRKDLPTKTLFFSSQNGTQTIRYYYPKNRTLDNLITSLNDLCNETNLMQN